jgi:hypothetical protein
MTLAKLPINPGIDKSGTQYSTGGSWHDCDKVRWRDGRPEKMGGWRKSTNDSYKGVCRSLFDWGTSSGELYVGLGTNLKFYVEQSGNGFFDITPIRETTSAGDVTFTATDGLARVQVNDTGHASVLNDFVTFSGAVSLGGTITADVLNQEYQIVELNGANAYYIDAVDPITGLPVTANSSDVGTGGAACVGEYQISVGTNAYASGGGWGAGAWGAGGWGAALAFSATNQLRLYSQDVFGQDLIFNVRGGGIYYWDESNGVSTRAFDISGLGSASNTPTVALQVMVSDVDRHVIAFGCNPLGSGTIDPLLIRWSDQEDAGNWTPGSTVTAGGQVMPIGSKIISALRTRREILVYTDAGIMSMRYSGNPYIYSFSPLAENVTVVGPKAAVVVGDVVFFMDRDGFYVYEGAVKKLKCPVHTYVFDDVDYSQGYKIHAGLGADNAEVFWFYPVSTGMGVSEISNYVSYNIDENLWAVGTLSRGAWINTQSRELPIATSADSANENVNYLYNHDSGWDDDGSPMTAYIESGGIEIGDGESLMFVRRLIPDFKFRGEMSNADISMKIDARKFPLQDMTEKADLTVTPSTTQNHTRIRAREIALRLQSDGEGYGWTMGDVRLDARTDGRR